jgi:uncharacterized protein YbjT (DUF2867 family)
MTNCNLILVRPLTKMSVNQLVVVIGGTRGTGLLIAQRLQHQGVPIRILARDPVSARVRLGPTLPLIAGDITHQDTIPRALEGAAHLVFTAGCRSGRPTTEGHIRETEYGGVVNTLTAAQRMGFGGRFLYMTASGVTSRSWATVLLNLYKGNTLVWRERAEHEIRGSGVEYTIIRAGILLNRVGGQRALVVTQRSLPLSICYRIARADVADVFAAALNHPRALRATFEVVWGDGPPPDSVPVLPDQLKPDVRPDSFSPAA